VKPSIVLHYWFTRRGRGEQIRLTLAELDLPWEEVETPFASAAWSAATPEPHWFGAQPALVVDGRSLTQSGVIVSYLAERWGLAPTDAFDRKRADAFTWSAEDLRLAVHEATRPEKPENRSAFLARDWPERWLRPLAHHLARDGWLVGGRLSHADVAWWDALDQARERVPELCTGEGAHVWDWWERVGDRPRQRAYRASPRRPPT